MDGTIMGGTRSPGTVGYTWVEEIDAGTSARICTPVPATGRSDRERFESAIQALEAELASIGAHLAVDGAARAAYARQIRAMAEQFRSQAANGAITWSRAAAEAHELRDTTRSRRRGVSTPVGRAVAEWLKREGPSLNELIARNTLREFGADADFWQLSPAQRNVVYSRIVESAGRSDPGWTALMRKLSPVGRGLLVLSIGLSVYTVAAADDPVDAAGREAAVTGAGIGGGIAGGALAGLACGPGAPVCVGVGAFVGGALAAFGVDFFW